MKKFIAPFALIILIASCVSKPANSISPDAQKNLDAMHGITKCFESKNFANLGDFMTTDAIDHSGETGEIKGLDSLKVNFAKWVTEGDTKMDVVKELADDNYVMSWMHDTGKYTTAEVGHAAGDKFDLNVMEVCKFKDGKATDHWSFMDPADMMKMQATMAMPTDTLKRKSK